MCLEVICLIALVAMVSSAPMSGENSTDFKVSIKFDETNTPYIDLGNDYKLKLELEEVNGIYKEKAEKVLGETPENVEKSLKALRKLLKSEKILIHIKVSIVNFQHF